MPDVVSENESSKKKDAGSEPGEATGKVGGYTKALWGQSVLEQEEEGGGGHPHPQERAVGLALP